jgi:ABC-type glycerol-3-phosphate transport system substrate-binding protein
LPVPEINRGGGGGAVTSPGISKEIVISVAGGAGSEQGWQAVIEAYKTVKPDVKISLELKPSQGYTEWLTKENSAGNVRADLVSNGPGNTTNGKWLDFYEYTNKTNPYTGKPWQDGLDMRYQKFESAAGHLETLAFDGIKTLLFYNADRFRELGFKPPETWDDLVALCETITAKTNYIPLAEGGSADAFLGGHMGWIQIIYADQYTRDWLKANRSRPGDFNYDPEIDGPWKYDPKDPYNDLPKWYVNQNPVRVFNNILDGTTPLNSPATRRIFENLKRVYPKYAPPGFFGLNSSYQLFLQEKALMYFGATWDAPSLYNDMQDLQAAEARMKEEGIEIAAGSLKAFNFATVPYPDMNDDLVQGPVRGFEGGTPGLSVVTKDKAHNDMVMDFVMFHTTGANYTKYLDAAVKGGGTPSGIIIIKDARMPAPYDTMMGDIKYGDGTVNDWNTQWFRGAGTVPEFQREHYNYTKDYLEGKIDINTWGQKLEQNFAANLDKILEANHIRKSDLAAPEKGPTGN